MKNPTARAFFLAAAMLASKPLWAIAPVWNVQLGVAETIAITSQTFSNGVLTPATALAGAYTNYLRRYDGWLTGQWASTIFRATLGLRGTVVLNEFYDSTGNGIPQSNVGAWDLALWPEVGVRLGKIFYAGTGFHFTPLGTGSTLNATESWNRPGPNALTFRLALDLRLGQSPITLGLGAGGGIPTGGEAKRAWVDGALRVDITYYISTELRYRAFFLGSRSPHDFYIGFQYRFTPQWSAAAHWSRLLYTEGFSPQNRVGASVDYSSKGESR